MTIKECETMIEILGFKGAKIKKFDNRFEVHSLPVIIKCYQRGDYIISSRKAVAEDRKEISIQTLAAVINLLNALD